MFQRLRHTLQSKAGADGASPGKRGGLPTIHMGANPFDVPDPTLAPTGAQQGEACDLHRASVGSYELVNERDLMRSSHSSMSLVDYEPDAAPDMARAPTIDAAGVAAAVTSPAYVGSAGVQQPTQGADARTILARFLVSPRAPKMPTHTQAPCRRCFPQLAPLVCAYLVFAQLNTVCVHACMCMRVCVCTHRPHQRRRVPVLVLTPQCHHVPPHPTQYALTSSCMTTYNWPLLQQLVLLGLLALVALTV